MCQGGDKNVRVKQVLEIEKQATTTPVGCGVALTERDGRRERKHQHRQEHYREVRERQRPRCSGERPYTAVEQAAGHVMARIGVEAKMTATREAIVKALGTWMREKGGDLAAAVNAMVARWLDYANLPHPRLFEFKPIGFFKGNHWASELGWGIDWRGVKQATEASVGVWRGESKPAIDMAALREKMAKLLENHTEDEGEDDGFESTLEGAPEGDESGCFS